MVTEKQNFDLQLAFKNSLPVIKQKVMLLEHFYSIGKELGFSEGNLEKVESLLFELGSSIAKIDRVIDPIINRS